jgi:SAM-dependent methyltransferase
VYLAQKGFDVVAVDISAKGLEKCAKLARERGVKVRTVVADLMEYDMGQSRYDLITDFYYYDPTLFSKVMAALKPGGLFVLQNFSTEQPHTGNFGPRNPAYLVRPNELLDHFARFRIRYYEDAVVDLDEGMHQGPGAVIRLIVEKASVK